MLQREGRHQLQRAVQNEDGERWGSLGALFSLKHWLRSSLSIAAKGHFFYIEQWAVAKSSFYTWQYVIMMHECTRHNSSHDHIASSKHMSFLRNFISQGWKLTYYMINYSFQFVCRIGGEGPCIQMNYDVLTLVRGVASGVFYLINSSKLATSGPMLWSDPSRIEGLVLIMRADASVASLPFFHRLYLSDSLTVRISQILYRGFRCHDLWLRNSCCHRWRSVSGVLHGEVVTFVLSLTLDGVPSRLFKVESSRCVCPRIKRFRRKKRCNCRTFYGL